MRLARLVLNLSFSFSCWLAVSACSRLLIESPLSLSGIEVESPPLKLKGQLDPSFAANGALIWGGAANAADVGYGVAIDSRKRIVVTGSTVVSTNSDLAVWRFTSSGGSDSSFNGTGVFTQNGAAGGATGIDFGRRVVLDSSGRIVVSGQSQNASSRTAMVLWRLNESGALDGTFNSNGFAVYDLNTVNNGEIGFGLAIDSSQRIYVGGQGKGAADDKDLKIWRYLSSGSLDTSFSSDGVANFNALATQGSDRAYALALDHDGLPILVGHTWAGSFNHDAAILKINAAGSLDTSYAGGAGFVRRNVSAINGADYAMSVAVDADNRSVVAGYSDNGAGDWDVILWRFNADGTADSSFNGNGFLRLADLSGVTKAVDEATKVLVSHDGTIYVAGRSKGTVNYEGFVAKIDPSTGQLDPSFGSGGVFSYQNAVGSVTINDLAEDSSGALIAVGSSTTASNTDLLVLRIL